LWPQSASPQLIQKRANLLSFFRCLSQSSTFRSDHYRNRNLCDAVDSPGEVRNVSTAQVLLSDERFQPPLEANTATVSPATMKSQHIDEWTNVTL
jgi:hypothetical protein